MWTLIAGDDPRHATSGARPSPTQTVRLPRIRPRELLPPRCRKSQWADLPEPMQAKSNLSSHEELTCHFADPCLDCLLWVGCMWAPANP